MITKPSGPHKAKILVIAARPGKHEVGLCYCKHQHPTGVGLVGPSGDLLWRLLGKHGITRRDCYVTNVRKDFSNEHSVPTQAEIDEVIGPLRGELDGVESNIILALGREALLATAGKSSIEKWRGSILESTLVSGRKVIGTWHPAAVFRRPEWVYVLDADVKRAVEQSKFPEIRRPRRTFVLDPTIEEGTSCLRQLKPTVSVDIECIGNKITCVGISDSPDFAICIPLIGSSMSISDTAVLVRELDWALRTRMLVGQNVGMFDQPMLRDAGFGVGYIKHDTMLAHHLLWPELGMKQKDDDGTEKYVGSHDLAFLVSIYTEEPYYKHLGQDWNKSNPPDWEMYWKYNCLDAATTYEVYLGLQEELEEFDQSDYYKAMVLALIRPVLNMQRKGLGVNTVKLHETRERMQLEAQVMQAQLEHKVGFSCNVRSTRDLQYLLHEVLHMRKLKTTAGGKPSTDKDTLLQLAYDSPHAELFKLILDIRERRTLTSGFLQMEVNQDGRYTAAYKLHGTDSGRLSSTSPSIFEGRKGPQLQNIPSRARSIFVARPGRQLVVSDLRRAEAMFVAYDAGDEGLICIFNDPSRDLYKEEACAALGVGDVSKVQRDVFKQVIHATHYGMRGKRLVSLLRIKGIYLEDVEIRGITKLEAKGEYLIRGYLDRHPAIREWQEETWRKVKRDRTLLDGLGRRRFFMGRLDDHMQRVVLSYRPQATVAGITNRGLITMDCLGWDVVLQVHDSLGVEARDSDVVACVADIEDALRCPIMLHGREMVIPTETFYGSSWGELDGVVASEILKIHRESRGSGGFSPMVRNDSAERSAWPEGVF